MKKRKHPKDDLEPEKKPRKVLPRLSCNKTLLKNALHRDLCQEDQIYIERLFSYIRKPHHLARHVTRCIKYWFLSYHLAHGQYPNLTEEHVVTMLYLLNKDSKYNPTTDIKRELRTTLLPVVRRYRLLQRMELMNMEHDQQTINFLATSVFTNIKTNVQEHFMQMLLRFVNLRMDIKGVKKRLSGQKEALQAFWQRLRWLKSVIMMECVPTTEEADGMSVLEKELYNEFRVLLPSEAENTVAYLVACDAMPFLPAYCQLSRLFEYHRYPQFSAIPLRRSLVQSHVQIDTTILYRHVLEMTRTQVESLPDMKHDLWSRIFRLESKAFQPRSGMIFDGSISTDGHSLTVLLKHPDAKRGRKGGKKSKATLQAEVKALYVEKNFAQLQLAVNIGVADPNKRDILFFKDMNTGTTFRYTSNQRAVETGSRRFRKKRQSQKRHYGISQIESTIPTHKTMNLQDYARFLISEAAVEDRLRPFYHRPIHRKMKFNAYRNTQKSESKLVANLKRLYGENFVMVLGDWSDAGNTMKFQASSKTKGWRTLFPRWGIPCFLFDEFRTSSRCFDCEDELNKSFWKRPSSRPWRRKEGKEEKVHGLLGCTNLNCKQAYWDYRFWNRDHLSVLNYIKILKSQMVGDGRPATFCRSVAGTVRSLGSET